MVKCRLLPWYKEVEGRVYTNEEIEEVLGCPHRKDEQCILDPEDLEVQFNAHGVFWCESRASAIRQANLGEPT